MLRVPLLPEVNSPETILFDYGPYFTKVFIVTLRRTQGHQKGQKLIGVLKLRTIDIKIFIDLYWRSVSNSASVILYNNPSEEFRTTIEQSFKHVIEESCGNMADISHKGLRFLVNNIKDELMYFPSNPEPDESFIQHLEWSKLDYPCLAVNIKERPSIHVFSGIGKSRQIDTSMLKPLSTFLSLDKDKILHSLKTLEIARMMKMTEPLAESTDKDSLTGLFQWLESVAIAVRTVAAENQVNGIYVTDCEFGLTETLMSSFHELLSTQNSSKIFFSRHADMITTIGASLGHAEILPSAARWGEDLLFSTGLLLHGGCVCEESLIISQFILEDLDMEFTRCPHFVEPENYQFELFNLYKQQTRNFILQAAWRMIQEAWKPVSKSDAVIRDVCDHIKPQAEAWLNYSLQCPRAFGKLYSTSFIVYITLLSRHFGLKDWLKKLKDQENAEALTFLEARLLQIDAIRDPLKKQVELFLGIIGGNLWDWLASEYQTMKASGNFDIYVAIDQIPERPWAVDHVEAWTDRLKKGYQKVIIFTDNSGADLILGLLPFARELLKSGSQVILSSNNEPVLNDVTYKEVQEIMKAVSCVCPILKECWKSGQLKAMPLGQKTPTLDLRHIPSTLASDMQDTDLYVFQGMARSAISNFKIDMTCDYLQTWLAKGIASLKLFDFEVRKLDGVCLFKQVSKPL